MKKAINIVLGEELNKELEEMSKRKNIPKATLIKLALTEYIEKNK